MLASIHSLAVRLLVGAPAAALIVAALQPAGRVGGAVGGGDESGVAVVDVDPGGRAGDRPASALAVTPDARYALFLSEARTLPRGDSPAGFDGPLVYRRDLRTDQVVLAGGTVDPGRGAPCAPDEMGMVPGRLMTPDGRYTVSTVYGGGACGSGGSASPRYSQVYVHDNATGRTRPASVTSGGEFGDGASMYPSLSGDGRHVAYQSVSRNLRAGDERFHAPHVYVHDMLTGENRLVDRGPDGRASSTSVGVLPSGHVLSGDGRRVIYLRVDPTTMVQDLHLVDLSTGRDRMLVADVATAQLSEDGRYVTYQGTAPSAPPLVLDTATGRARPSSPAASGSAFRRCRPATLDPTNRFAAYNCTTAPSAGSPAGYTSIYRQDLSTGEVRRVDTAGTTAPLRQESGPQQQIAAVTARGAVLFTSSWPGYVPSAPPVPHAFLSAGGD